MHTSMSVMNGRYVSQEVLGNGTYGCVLRCADTRNGGQVAVKISQQDAAYRRSAMNEIRVLQLLAHNEESLNMFDFFEEDGRLCIVTELLRTNFYEILRAHQFQPLSLDAVRIAGERVLRALVRLHSLGYIHCDIKPENVMLRPSESDPCNVEDFRRTCLIDFGAVRQFHENKYYDIQSLWYRAPEVLLGLPYTSLIDAWSLGCLLFELYTGKPLFPGETPQEEINSIVYTVGFPSKKAMAFGVNATSLQLLQSTKRTNAEANLRNLIRKYRYSSENVQHPHPLSCEEVTFVNLLCQLLHPDENHRMSCTDALSHLYFSQYSPRKDIEKTTFSPPSFCNSSFMPTGECSFVGGISSSGSELHSLCFHEHFVQQRQQEQQQEQQHQQQPLTIIPHGGCGVVPLVTFVGDPSATILQPPLPLNSTTTTTAAATATVSNVNGVAIAPSHVFVQNMVYPKTSTPVGQPLPFHVQRPHAEHFVNASASSMANTPTMCRHSFPRPPSPPQREVQQTHSGQRWSTAIAPSRMISVPRCNQHHYNDSMLWHMGTDYMVYQVSLKNNPYEVIYAP